MHFFHFIIIEATVFVIVALAMGLNAFCLYIFFYPFRMKYTTQYKVQKVKGYEYFVKRLNFLSVPVMTSHKLSVQLAKCLNFSGQTDQLVEGSENWI